MSRGKDAKHERRSIVSFVAIATASALSSVAFGSTSFFDWEVPSQTAPAPYVGAPHLTNSAASAAAVQAYWAAHPTDPKAVRVTEDLTDPAALNIFRTNTVSYVFADFEGTSIASRTSNLVGQVRWNPITSSNTPSVSAYIGNYQVFPVYPDATASNPGTTGTTATGYYNTGINMAMEQLYPGSPSFRGPGSANGGSTSPNIRSNLFTMPLSRFSAVESNLQGTLFQNRPAPLPQKDAHIPLVTRFNNWNNVALTNTSTIYSPYSFDTSIGGNANQLLARGDFAALIAHYRARGAESYNLFEPGVVGYTKAQMQADAQIGWSVWDPLFLSGRTAVPALLDITGTIDGTTKTFEQTGIAYSGMYQVSDGNPWTPDILEILLSNLDGVSHSVSFTQAIDGALFTSGNTFNIAPGDHRLLEFTQIGGYWDLASNTPVTGTDSAGNNAWPDMNRNGIGIPEPTTAMLMGGVVGLMALRRRRQPELADC